MAYDPFAGCPLPTALATVTDSACPLRLDQIVALGIKRKGATAAFTTTGSASTLITTSAAWTTLTSATDSTKLILTPAFAEFVIPESEPVIEGENDNSTIGGLGLAYAGPPVRGMGKLLNKQSAQITILKGFMKEFSNFTSIRGEVFFINRFGQVFCNSSGFGFDFTNFTVGGRSSEGYNKPDKNGIGLTLPYGWDNDMQAYVPAFDILATLPK